LTTGIKFTINPKIPACFGACILDSYGAAQEKYRLDERGMERNFDSKQALMEAGAPPSRR
jgi:hypothetical protein